MKMLVFSFLFSIPIAISPFRNSGITSNENRFVITINGKKGFINQSGEVVIPPQFQQALEFSEGFCAVRIDGRYGFINTRGELCIPAIYDFATTFEEGLALVYLDGKPLFIRPDGKIAFPSDYQYMFSYSDGRAYVITSSGKWGILNKQGELVIDTIYQKIGPFEGGFAIVHGLDHQESDLEDKTRNPQVSVIDVYGKMLFPYGRFESIEDYNDGYFNVNFPERKGGNISVGAIVNMQGEIVFSLPKNQESWIEGSVHHGIVRVSLPMNNRSNDYYDAYVTLNGKKVYANKRTYYGTDFEENVAFVGDKDFKYSLINRKGELISKEKFRLPGYDQNPFQNGMAVVKFNDNNWGVIDTTARIVLKTTYEHIYPEALVQNQYLFYQNEDNDSQDVRYGLINLEGKVLIPPVLQDFDTRGFVNDLLRTTVDNKITYFDRDGNRVWQDVIDERRELAPLNIDYMNRGYFYANYNYTGHPSESRHTTPKEVDDAMGFTKGALNLIAVTDENLSFFEIAKGMRVELANTTSDTMMFKAQDNRLYMKMQAIDKTGNWRDIEYLPNSWCGNSYHSVQLPPNHYWSFVAPIYEGVFDTKMRITLTYLDPSEKPSQSNYRNNKDLILYSAEFNGSINPAQFWRRPGYSPSGIMDPYNE